MQIKLSPTDANYIKEAVRNGYFPNEEEAVTAAVRMMRQETEARQQRLIEAIQLGRDDVAAGRVEEYTPELLEQIFEEAIGAVESDRQQQYIVE